MKKQYHKPELYFENFSLMGSVSSCSTVVSSATLETCRFDVLPFGTVHSEALGGGCDQEWGGGKGFCWTTPNGTLSAFGS